MSTHTPGPWKIGDHPFDIVRSTSDDEYVVVATAAHDRQGLNRGRETSEANARLIAAAPELLEACKRLLKFNEELAVDVNVSTHYPSADFARAAIAKAEGR